MINRMKATTIKVTDFNIGSVVRTMLEAIGVEIDELYQQVFHGLMEAIPVATYNSFDFSLLPPIPASGSITVNITVQPTDTLIAAGTVFTPNGGSFTYISASDVHIAAGSTTASVIASANTGGALTNLPAGTTFSANPQPSGFVSASNIAAFSNGADEETADQRKLRFNQYIQALQRGTVAALQYGAKQTVLYDANGVEIERVRSVKVVEPWKTDNTQPISLVNVYVHNGVGSTSSALVAQAQNVMYGYYDASGNAVPGWSAAGVQVVLFAATEVIQNIVGALTPVAGTDVASLNIQAKSVISNYMLGLDIGKPLQVSEITALVMAIPGVANFILATPLPTSDVAVANNQKIMPGTINVTNNLGAGVAVAAAPSVVAHT